MYLRIAFDLDNTIAIYDHVFSKLGKQLKNIPSEVTFVKQTLADYLRQHGREIEWTKLQGRAYGPGMASATVAKNFKTQLKQALDQKHTCFIVSHRTQFPASGEKYDLHSVARHWLADNFGDVFEKVFFEETLDAKIQRIQKLELDVFVDDLQKVLKALNLPYNHKFHYAPHLASSTSLLLKDWQCFPKLLKGIKK